MMTFVGAWLVGAGRDLTAVELLTKKTVVVVVAVVVVVLWYI